MTLADFPEVYLDPSVRRSFEMAQHRRLAAGQLDIQTDGAPEELDRLFMATERAWERLGTEEPYWSVVTSNDFKIAQIANTRASFYESGAFEVGHFRQALKRVGAGRIEHLLEIGCGVGRMTHHFARYFPRVTAVDISSAHIDLARAELDSRGVDNANFLKVASPRDYASIRGYDAIYSFIVLQHSPPPIVVEVLKSLLGNMNNGGYAYFHLPTFIEGYSFSIDSYLAHTKGEMEMHCVPQAKIFELLKGFDILEVINDGSGGDYRFECLRFLARKA